MSHLKKYVYCEVSEIVQNQIKYFLCTKTLFDELK